MEQAVYAALEKKDIEELLKAYTDKFNDATCRLRLEELAQDAWNEEIRPIVKKLAKFVELWEEADAKERASDELCAILAARSEL